MVHMALTMLWFLDSSFTSISHKTLGMKQEIPLRTSGNGKSFIQCQVIPLASFQTADETT